MDRVSLYQQLIDDFGGPKKAAEALGVSQATTSSWRLGIHGMSPSVAIRIERITNQKYRAVDLSEQLAALRDDPSA
jgi:DNA-binding transcriptional regulator YdaS (Cro superfamily)